MIKIVARHYRVQLAHDVPLRSRYIRTTCVKHPDNNHLSGTIARCINRVLSSDINDETAISRALGPLDITAIVLSDPLSFVHRTVTSASLLFSNETFDRHRIYLSTYHGTKNSFPS